MLIFFILFLSMFIINLVVISKLKRKYPKAYDLGGKPSGLLSNSTNASFTYGFIGLRLYRKEDLDKNTRRWCDFLCIVTWAFLLNFFYSFYILIDNRL